MLTPHSTAADNLNPLVCSPDVYSKIVNAATKKLSDYVVKLAMLGGYLARKNDPPPGNLVIWRGLNRLADIALGFGAKDKLVGN